MLFGLVSCLALTAQVQTLTEIRGAVVDTVQVGFESIRYVEQGPSTNSVVLLDRRFETTTSMEDIGDCRFTKFVDQATGNQVRVNTSYVTRVAENIYGTATIVTEFRTWTANEAFPLEVDSNCSTSGGGGQAIGEINTYYVSGALGNDGTGEVGNQLLSYQTLDGTPWTTQDNVVFRDGVDTLTTSYEAMRSFTTLRGSSLFLRNTTADTSSFFVNGGSFDLNVQGELSADIQTEAVFKFNDYCKFNGKIDRVTMPDSKTGLATFFYWGAGDYNLEVDEVVHTSASDLVWISDEFAPYTDLDSSSYKIRINKYHSIRNGNQGNRVIWLYGPRVNNTDTIRNIFFDARIDQYTYDFSSLPSYNSAVYRLGGSSDRLVTENSTINLSLGRYECVEYPTTPLSVGYVNSPSGKVVVVNGAVEHLYNQMGGFINSHSKVAIESFRDTTAYTPFYNFGNSSDRSSIEFDLGYLTVRGPVFSGASTMDNSTTTVSVKKATVMDSVHCVLLRDVLTNGSELIIEGHFVGLDSTYAPIGLWSASVDASSKIILRDVKIETENQYAIVSEEPITLHVQGTLDLGGKPVGPNVTLVYLDTDYPSYANTAAAAADTNLLPGQIFKVTNGDGTSTLHVKD